MTEHRSVTAEEFLSIAAVAQQYGVTEKENCLRFIDTQWDKIYDVWLLQSERGKFILKKDKKRRGDKTVYFIFRIPRLWRFWMPIMRKYAKIPPLLLRERNFCGMLPFPRSASTPCSFTMRTMRKRAEKRTTINICARFSIISNGQNKEIPSVGCAN